MVSLHSSLGNRVRPRLKTKSNMGAALARGGPGTAVLMWAVDTGVK